MKHDILQLEIARCFGVHREFSKKDILDSLRSRGIKSIDELISDLHNRYVAGCPRPATVIGNEAIEKGLRIKHRKPKIPLRIDGVDYDPADISRFDDRPLHFVYYQENGRTLLQATTDRNQINALYLIFPQGGWTGDPEHPGWVRYDLGPGSSSGAPPQPKTAPYGYDSVQMFSDANWDGDWFWLPRKYEWPRLSKVSRGTFLWSSGDWNDQISSMGYTVGAVTYFEHANFQGSSFTVPAGGGPSELDSTGWNDRISSVRYPQIPGWTV